MKAIILLGVFLVSFATSAQFKSGENVSIDQPQEDDVYLAGELISINQPIHGDVVASGGTIIITDSIKQDLIVAGGELTLKGYVADDVRAAGGKLYIDSEVGDDVVVAGGEIRISKNSVIHGNLVTYSGDLQLDGDVKGFLKVSAGKVSIFGNIGQDAKITGGEVYLDGEFYGKTQIIAEQLTIGINAKFNGEVTYWTEKGEVDFKNALINTTATYNEDLRRDEDEFSIFNFTSLSIGLILFYLFSVFLILLLLNALFKNKFPPLLEALERSKWNTLGYGLLYIFGLPLVILITIITLVGIPIGLFLLVAYLFSLLFGHIIAALFITYYINNRREKKWGFWTIVFLALGFALLLRLVTLIPIIGWIISVVVLGFTYGLFMQKVIKRKEVVV
ncbi:polymer-forming cytoskeletal protein [Flavobacteriaceae bacterium KMM 6898]|nr:polymer-forming cytoskeletal protein [Flavobacteriaceae bacterium KMM 6898]